EARAAHDAFLALPDLPRGIDPGMLSVSFGSYSAIELAAERPISSVIVFGGFASFEDAIRFSMRGVEGRPHDPLNRPAVFMNLFDHVEGMPRERDALFGAW